MVDSRIAASAALDAGVGREGPLAADCFILRIEQAARRLSNFAPPRSAIGLLADNSPAWLTADLATHASGHRLVPLPAFFTLAQRLHAARACSMQGLLCSDRQQAEALGFDREAGAMFGLKLFCAAGSPPQTPADAWLEPVQKITYTSGTTGTSKGVALTHALQWETAAALAQRLAPLGIRRHLSLLPFPVLLENVAGAYTALHMGATCICPPSHCVGITGAVGFDGERCLEAIGRFRPHSLILLPQMLRALVERLEAAGTRDPRLSSLAFVAVGGAKTPVRLLLRARALGLPVYEGYGLSECGSVVCLNVPGEDQVGSAGKPLPGISVGAGAEHELSIRGRLFSGYLGERPQARPEWFPTGDLGAVDDEGFVHVHGRRKNVLITAFGRNVSPEWPEQVLLLSPSLAQAAVFGDDRPYLVAVLVPSSQASEDDLHRAVQSANRMLPDYARIGGWIRATERFRFDNGLTTANARVRREAVRRRYAEALERVYRAQQSSAAQPSAPPARSMWEIR
jgi:long-subunit acyl-CoA synthetase (AMP-forming)